jgi:hypothetical protein
MVLQEETGESMPDGTPCYAFRLVEVVRRGKKNTRIRKELDDNTHRTILVPTERLSEPVQ